MLYQEIFSMDPMELAEWLIGTFTAPIPSKIETIDELTQSVRIMNECTNNWAYLQSLLAIAKINVRRLERESSPKKNPDIPKEILLKKRAEYEDMVDRQYALQKIADVIIENKNTISRNITAKQEINKELDLLGNIP